jgi:hypothetical protein
MPEPRNDHGPRAVRHPGSVRAKGHRLRSYRASSWIRRAQALLAADLDGRFIFYWIAFNALYGQAKYRQEKTERVREEKDIETFLNVVMQIDRDEAILKTVADLRGTPAQLIRDPFLSDLSWKRWDSEGIFAKMDRERAAVQGANGRPPFHRMFGRLYVLRKQIFHGCSSEGGRKNRESLLRAVAVLEKLVPIFSDLVWEHGDGIQSLDRPPYPPSEADRGWNQPRITGRTR